MTTTLDVSIERSRDVERSIATHPQQHRMLTGDRPTGDLHTGHYLSSLLNRVALQNQGVECMVLVADYQVITDRDSAGRIRADTLSLLADYLAAASIRRVRRSSRTRPSPR